ncbi:ornithine carbamoyltransferase isoform 1 [Galdieria sulphuraria]|uniref:ornithine carbamoyltransferase n=1 Tax=Galdieria sulphuraria TaxID=130081 RepID=M2X7W0_GALSU|nr:ornithine carbamoyltransferase isoform 1 [Galdieria sulphuraria]EME32640.1 ornithine carbamoyltransferase isoform 1 [Galdieria sulphuraria]|eukprot:XP_005709160.1 ornithine carbamoyltransferase isoform 1 [Galdieria sulphuraria]
MTNAILLFQSHSFLSYGSFQGNKSRSFGHQRSVEQQRRLLRSVRPKSSKSLHSLSSLADPSKHHFLHVNDLTSSQLSKLLQIALEMKLELKQLGKYRTKPLDGKTLAMIFAKPSARTRISFETGMYLLGGHALYLGEEVGIGKREAVKDVARVVSSMNDTIMARLYAHSDLLELARFSKVPVINGLTDYNHPCQIIADALTILEEKKRLQGVKVVYIGDGNNIVHSWLELTSLVELEFTCCCPEGYEPNPTLLDLVNRSHRGKASIEYDPWKAVVGADVIYTDVWASMGQKSSLQQRMEVFSPYQVTMDLMKASQNKDTIFMHCLPAERGRECDDKVMESHNSKVFQQAENRMHAQNAILLYCHGILNNQLV